MRVVTTNKRINHKNRPKIHNDRKCPIEKIKHIDSTRTHKNLGYTWDKSKTMEEAERNYYINYFQKGLDAKNERYVKNGHKERIKTIEDILTDTKTCPEEGIKQIGKMGDTIDEKLAIKIMTEYINWKRQTFPNCVLLDAYIHLDETTPHMHERSVFIGHDKDGNLIPNQNKALKEMGIERPDKTKPENRYNNAKITFDKICRDRFIEICQSYGLTIEKEPKERTESGLTLIEYKARQEEQKAQKAIDELNSAIKALEGVEAAKNEAIQVMEETQKVAHEAAEEAETLKKENTSLKQENESLKQENDITKDIYSAYKSDMGAIPPRVIKEIPEKKNLRGQVIEEACVIVPKKAYYESLHKVKIFDDLSRMQRKTKELYDSCLSLIHSSELIQGLRDKIDSLTERVKAYDKEVYSLSERLKRRENELQSKSYELYSYRSYLEKKGLLYDYEMTVSRDIEFPSL